MPVQAETLLQLQDLDTRLAGLTRQRQGLDDGSSLRATAEGIARGVAEAERRLHQLQSDQQAAELELQTVEQKKKREEQRLYSGRVTVPRELEALGQEIEMLGRQRSRLDEKILTLMDEVEQTSGFLTTLCQKRDATQKRWEEHRRQYLAEVKRLDAEIARLSAERASVAAEVEPATLRTYEDLRVRSGGLAAVPLEGNLCGGCRTNVSVVIARQVLQRERYVRCESCNRFLLPANRG